MRGRATWNPRPTSNRRILARFLLAVSARLAFPRITPLCPHGDARREKETQDTRGGGAKFFSIAENELRRRESVAIIDSVGMFKREVNFLITKRDSRRDREQRQESREAGGTSDSQRDWQ